MLYRFYVSLLVLSLALCLFAQEGEEKKETKTHTRLVVLDLAGSYPEHSAVEGLENQTSLHQLLELIYACKDDAQVDGLILKVSGVGMGYGKLTAVIQALRQFRTTGKPIYCFLESAMTQHYLLAAQASRLSLYPTGEIFIPGVAMQMVFMKGLLEMLGVEADFITQGKYKAAAEAMTRESSSPESREANEAMLDDFYEGLLEEIASARKLSKSDAKQVINGGMFSGKEALAAKLVDHCEYPDEFEAALQASHPLPIKKITDYKKKKRPELNTNNPFALFQVLSQILNPQKKKESKNPKIAILYASGGISSGKAPAPSFFGSTEGIYSDDLVKEIRSLRDNETVKAVVFRIDSGGGSALASDVIHREIELLKAKKPVIASMSDVAASGGYYIAAPCDLIFAEKLTITGSIGVLGGENGTEKSLRKTRPQYGNPRTRTLRRII
jgi:protease-4